MQVSEESKAVGARGPSPGSAPDGAGHDGTVELGFDRGKACRAAALGARFLGALALLAVGAVHLQQYEYLYSSIPTIGTLFLLDFVGATAIGLGLLAPVEHLPGRVGRAAAGLLALAGAVQAATAFVFLLVAERTPLFGFQEPGYDPPALMASRVAELVTVALLGGFLAARLVSRRSATRW
jgi:hypothetical protein